MSFIKTTVIGGVVFLIPVIVLVMVIGKALEITGKIAAPIANSLPGYTIAGPILSHVVAAAILVAVCFVAGIVAKAAIARKAVDSLERNVVSKVPAYAFLKTKTQSIFSEADAEGMTPVIARLGDSWQIAFEVERAEPDRVVIFIPGAPDPWSGSVCVVAADQITPLDLPLTAVTKCAKSLGKGTNQLISGQPLIDPRSA